MSSKELFPEGADSLGFGPDERPAVIRAYDAFTGGLFNVSMLVLLLGMTLGIGADVILRFTIGAPIRGTHDIVTLSLLLLFLTGLPHSWRASHHVRMDMLYGAMPEGLRRMIDVFACVTALVFAAMLAYQAFRYVPSLQRIGSGTMLLRIPYWPFAIAIGVSATLFGIAVLMDLFMAATGRKPRSR
jgi:TRAP-type C4-dicarboxylate transport system permease small subunit